MIYNNYNMHMLNLFLSSLILLYFNFLSPSSLLPTNTTSPNHSISAPQAHSHNPHHWLIITINFSLLLSELALLGLKLTHSNFKMFGWSLKSLKRCYQKSTAKFYTFNKRAMKYHRSVIILMSLFLSFWLIKRLFVWKGYEYILCVASMTNCALFRHIVASGHSLASDNQKIMGFILEIFKYFNIIIITIFTGIVINQPAIDKWVLGIIWTYQLISSNQTLGKSLLLYLMLFVDSIALLSLFSLSIIRVRGEDGYNLKVIFFLIEILGCILYILLELGNCNASIQKNSFEQRCTDLQIYGQLAQLRFQYIPVQELKEEDIQNPQDRDRENTEQNRSRTKINFSRAINQECPICLQNLKQEWNIKLKCSHCYHLDCIQEWIVTSDEQSCPMCRSLISVRI